MKINVDEITPRQILTIAKGLCDYQYIMEHWKDNDADFRTVYYEFYLKARWAVMTNSNNSNPYYQKLQEINGNEDLIDIIEELYNEMEKKNFEFSLTTKLLHTRNPKVPIYDSKVRRYLTTAENVNLWYQCKGTPHVGELEKIKHDWHALVSWYSDFLKTQCAYEWITWFDEHFPAYVTIADVKKIDFIIFATN